ncbi:peptidase [Planctomycetales bacterium]|nr:peptidase [Planctomycetales bacterium]GHT35216.1 peptidase [Planctomycetales bacterium]
MPSRRQFITAMTGTAITGVAAGAETKADKNEDGKPKKILMPIGDATETLDTFYPFFRLPEAGFEVVVCGPEKRLYHTVLHEVPPDSSIPWDITQERPSYFIKATAAFREIDPAEYFAVFVSGGRAPEYLRYDKDLIRIMRHFGETKKIIASVCHGIELLTAGGCIRGKKVTCVQKCQSDAEQGGGIYVNEPVVRDGNVISCQTWHNYTPFFRQLIPMLNGES